MRFNRRDHVFRFTPLANWPTVFLLMAFFILAPAQVFAQDAKPSKWTPEVMIKYKRLAGTAISPDGKWVAYTVSEPLMEGEKSEYRTHIFLAGADGKTDFQLTQGDKSCNNPQWSRSQIFTRWAMDCSQLRWRRYAVGKSERHLCHVEQRW